MKITNSDSPNILDIGAGTGLFSMTIVTFYLLATESIIEELLSKLFLFVVNRGC